MPKYFSFSMRYFAFLTLNVLSIFLSARAFSQPNLSKQIDSEPNSAVDDNLSNQQEICEFFTAHTLKNGQWKLGTTVEFASSKDLQISNDVLSTLFGVLGLGLKYNFITSPEYLLSGGLRISYADEHTMIWGSTKDSFDEIHASILQPSIHLSFPFAQRMQWHQLFAVGLGTAQVSLSDAAKNRLKESKEKQTEELSSSNQESESSKISRVAERTLQVGAIASGLSDIYQSSFEYKRDSGHRVIFTIKHQRTEVESLKASITSFTLAHHWFGKHMNLRLGFGAQFAESSGQDLDGENLSNKEWQPANDINLYWVF